jgi:hypothetical protein
MYASLLMVFLQLCRNKMTQAEGVKRMMQLSSGSVLVVGVLVLVALLILLCLLSVVRRISSW